MHKLYDLLVNLETQNKKVHKNFSYNVIVTTPIIFIAQSIFFFKKNYNKFDITLIFLKLKYLLCRHLEHGISNVELNIKSLMNNDSPYWYQHASIPLRSFLEKLYFITLNYTLHHKFSECMVRSLNYNSYYTLHPFINFDIILDGITWKAQLPLFSIP